MTVSVADLNTMTSQAEQYIDEGATLLKVKLDNEDVVEKIAAIRALSSEVKIVIDANEAWASL